MYENKPAHYEAVIRFYRGSPGSFCTAIVYDTKQTGYGGRLYETGQAGKLSLRHGLPQRQLVPLLL